MVLIFQRTYYIQAKIKDITTEYLISPPVYLIHFLLEIFIVYNRINTGQLSYSYVITRKWQVGWSVGTAKNFIWRMSEILSRG